MNWLHSLRTKNTLESHERVNENKDFCTVAMPSEDTKILEFNEYKKPDKASFIIYADLECTIEKTDGCNNNPENSSIAKVSKHRSIGNKYDVYRGKDCIKKFCKFLREHIMKIINFKKKKMKLLRRDQEESYENAKICHICDEKFENKYLNDK